MWIDTNLLAAVIFGSALFAMGYAVGRIHQWWQR